MDLEKKTNSNDFLLTENLLDGKKKVVSNKTTPKDIILNAISALLVMVVVTLCNIFISGEFQYEQLKSWSFGLLVVVNWICGIMMTYFTRQSAINTAKSTQDYVSSEEAKQDAFLKIEDYPTAQRILNVLIDEDFDLRRSDLELAIAKLVRPKMPKKEDGTVEEWCLGKPLPKHTHIKVRRMLYKLERMTPPSISLAGLVQSEATYKTDSLYEVRPSPARTGTMWFAKKGAGKVIGFAAAPVIFSILGNGLTGKITLENIVSAAGILGWMLFNAAREYTIAYASVARYGVDRNKQIVQIINTILKKQNKL